LQASQPTSFQLINEDDPDNPVTVAGTGQPVTVTDVERSAHEQHTGVEVSSDPSPAVAVPQSTPTVENEILNGEEVPDLYRGKSARELLDIIQQKEAMVGRQANELGELRNQNGTLRGVVDQAIAMQAGTATPNPVDEVTALTPDSLLSDPDAAISDRLNRALRPLEDRISALTAQERQNEFLGRHKTALEDVNDDAFVNYVKASPYRERLAQKAFQDMRNIDFDAAEELWLGYEDVRGSSTPPAAESEGEQAKATAAPAAARPNPAEAALVTSGTSAGAGDAHSDKTIYSAAALTKLQMEDPDAYYEPNFYNKISVAWGEGRVQ
jgi:hypothetical protein